MVVGNNSNIENQDLLFAEKYDLINVKEVHKMNSIPLLKHPFKRISFSSYFLG